MLKTSAALLLALVITGATILIDKTPEKGDGVTQTLKKMGLCSKYHCNLLDLATKLELYEPKTRFSKIIYPTDRFIVAKLDSGDCIFVARGEIIITPIVLLARSIGENRSSTDDVAQEIFTPKVIPVETLSKKDQQILTKEQVRPFNWSQIKTVRTGATGSVVKELNYLLQKHVLDYKPKQVEVFDEATCRAVKSFQKSNQLRADGIVGKKTLDALFLLPNY